MSIRVLLSTALAMFAPTTNVDPLASIPLDPIDIELNAASIHDTYAIMGKIAQTPIQLDSCVEGTIDIKLHNVALRMVFEELAASLALEYHRGEDGALVVGCLPQHREGSTVTLQLHDSMATDVFGRLVPLAQVTGCTGRRIDLDVRNASSAAVIAGLAAELPATYEWNGEQLDVRCR